MSPIPSPTPLRRTLARLLFSPAGLLFGFVVLLITTCPGARGEGSLGMLAENNGGLFSSSAIELAKYDSIRVNPTHQPSAAIGRSTRLDRVPTSSARSATPMERGAAAPAPVDAEAFRHSRSTLPLLVDPMLDETARASSAGIRPMTGPAVGIRPKLPTAAR